MDPRVALLREIADLNARLVRNCLDGVSPAQWMERPCKEAANMAFIAWHLLDARYYVISLLGGQRGNPFKDQLDAVTAIDQAHALPGLVEFRLGWRDADESLAQAMMSARPGILAREAGHPFPVGDPRASARSARTGSSGRRSRW